MTSNFSLKDFNNLEQSLRARSNSASVRRLSHKILLDRHLR